MPYVTYREDNTLISNTQRLLDNSTHYVKLKSVSFGNIMLKRGSIVLLNVDNDELPIFAEIMCIFKTNTSVSLLPSDFTARVKYLIAIHFNIHYQAFAINISEEFNTITFDCLQYFKVHTLIQKADGDFYISY